MGNGIGVGVSSRRVTVRRPVEGRVVVGAIALPLRHLRSVVGISVYSCLPVCQSLHVSLFVGDDIAKAST